LVTNTDVLNVVTPQIIFQIKW